MSILGTVKMIALFQVGQRAHLEFLFLLQQYCADSRFVEKQSLPAEWTLLHLLFPFSKALCRSGPASR